LRGAKGDIPEWHELKPQPVFLTSGYEFGARPLHDGELLGTTLADARLDPVGAGRVDDDLTHVAAGVGGEQPAQCVQKGDASLRKAVDPSALHSEYDFGKTFQIEKSII